MKIIYVTVGFPFGPGEAFLIPELRELIARGHELLIVPLRPGRRVVHADAAEFVQCARHAPLCSFAILQEAIGEFSRHFRIAAPVMRLLLTARGLRMTARNAAIIAKGLWLAAMAREWGADYIHAYWASTPASAAFIAGECAGIPWSFTGHRHDIARDNLLRKKTEHAAFARVISQSGLQMLRAAAGDLVCKAFVLHAGIQMPPKPTGTERHGRFTVLCPANLIAVKGHRYLIEAVAMLRNAGVDIELWLAGDGELRSQIERQIAERQVEKDVRVLGQMPHDALLSLYRKGEVDAVVLPSIDLGNGNHEGIPVALMEAMACAVPVVATETGGIPELIGGGAGLLVPPADPPALAAALTKLAGNANLRRSLGLAGSKRVEESFDVREIVTELVRRFEESRLKYGTAKANERPAMLTPHQREASPGATVSTQPSVGSRVRVGVLVDGPDAPVWVHETIEEMLRAEHLELKLLIMTASTEAEKSCAPVLFRWWSWADRRLFAVNADGLRCERRKHAIETVVVCALREAGSPLTVSKNDEARIKAANLDVIVNVTSGDVPRDIKDCAKYGVWSFVSKNGDAWEGDHAGFDDLRQGNHVSALILRAKTAVGESELYCSNFSIDKLSLYRNQNSASWLKSQILLRRLTDLYKKGWPSIQLPSGAPEGGIDGISKPATPGNAAMARFVAGWFLKASNRLLSNSVSSERWFIAYHDKRSGQSASAKILMPPRGWNYADPFLYECDGKHYIFFEAASDLKPKGEVWFVELDEAGNPSLPERALAREYHLSYPMVFEWKGETYLLPESSQNESVEVFRAVEFPRRWELAGTLLSNVPAVDSTLFERNGKLWLFTAGIGGKHLKCSELSLFFSDSLFGPWIPHSRNPIVCDISRARPAGSLFYKDGELIRPAQDCSECYGHAITLNRVDVLSETDYRETSVGNILPDWAGSLSATHTLNMNSRYEVLDAKSRTARYAFATRSCTPRLRWPDACRLLENANEDSGSRSPGVAAKAL